MKKRCLILAVIAPLATALPLSAQEGMHHSMPGMSAQAGKAEGTVNKVDAATGKVNISHDPIPSLKWPAMTMDFNLKNKADAAELRLSVIEECRRKHISTIPFAVGLTLPLVIGLTAASPISALGNGERSASAHNSSNVNPASAWL